MQNLIRQEQFELEVLEKLNSEKILPDLVFCGGTMLRLCLGLDRFSVDLDFWLTKRIEFKKLFKKIKEALDKNYEIKDSANKFNTLLFEIRSKNFTRSLKIEIRKEKKEIKTENSIAFSNYSNIQVILRVVSAESMMKAKVGALLNRKEIRDAFDLEFLIKKGINLQAKKAELNAALKVVDSFSRRDYTVKLGSLLEAEKRKYYSSNNFKILKSAINEKMLDLTKS